MINITTFTLPKHYSDVHWDVVIKQAKNANSKAPVAILTSSGKDTTTIKTETDIDDLVADYNENTGVYALGKGVFNASTYDTYPLEIIDASKNSQTDGVTTTTDNGKVTSQPNTINGALAAARDHIYDGFMFLLVDVQGLTTAGIDVKETVNGLVDLAYQSQQFYFIHQSSSLQDLSDFYAHVKSLEDSDSKFYNSKFVYENSTRQPAANAAGYIGASVMGSANLVNVGSPVAFEHIHDEPEMQPVQNLGRNDSDALDSMNVAYVVSKADNAMFSNGKSAGTNAGRPYGDWVDYFINFKKIYDMQQYALQEYLNLHDWPEFDQKHADEVKAKMQNLDNNFVSAGYESQKSDFSFKPVNQVMQSDISKRIYRYVNISPYLANVYDKFSGLMTITV